MSGSMLRGNTTQNKAAATRAATPRWAILCRRVTPFQGLGPTFTARATAPRYHSTAMAMAPVGTYS